MWAMNNKNKCVLETLTIPDATDAFPHRHLGMTLAYESTLPCLIEDQTAKKILAMLRYLGKQIVFKMVLNDTLSLR